MLGSSFPSPAPPMATYDRYENGLEKEPGPLHEPVQEPPIPGFCSIEGLPSLIVSPHCYHMCIDKEPGLLHEPVWNTQLLEEPETETGPPVVTPPCRCQKWLERPISPLHEPLWEQPPLGGSLLLQTPPEPIEFDGGQKEKRQHRDHLHEPVMKQQPTGSSQPECERRKEKPLGPLHEPVWYQLPFVSYFLQRVASRLDLTSGHSLQGAEREASGSSQAEEPPPVAVAPPRSSQMGREKWLGPLHEPLWDQPPLGSSLLLQCLPEPIEFDSCSNDLKKEPGLPHGHGSSQPERTGPAATPPRSHPLGPHCEPAWDQLPLGSSRLGRVSSMGVLPGQGQEVGGRALGPLHQPFWE